MRITTKGQVTIPIDLRERFGLLPHTEVEFVADGKALRLIKKRGAAGRGKAIVEHMRGHPGTSGMSTDEIMELTRGEEVGSGG